MGTSRSKPPVPRNASRGVPDLREVRRHLVRVASQTTGPGAALAAVAHDDPVVGVLLLRCGKQGQRRVPLGRATLELGVGAAALVVLHAGGLRDGPRRALLVVGCGSRGHDARLSRWGVMLHVSIVVMLREHTWALLSFGITCASIYPLFLTAHARRTTGASRDLSLTSSLTSHQPNNDMVGVVTPKRGRRSRAAGPRKRRNSEPRRRDRRPLGDSQDPGGDGSDTPEPPGHHWPRVRATRFDRVVVAADRPNGLLAVALASIARRAHPLRVLDRVRPAGPARHDVVELGGSGRTRPKSKRSDGSAPADKVTRKVTRRIEAAPDSSETASDLRRADRI